MAIKFQKACDTLNNILQNKPNNFIDLINDIIYNKVFRKGGELYWQRELYIDCNCDMDKCREKINADDVMFEPTFDTVEHPGITFGYKKYFEHDRI